MADTRNSIQVENVVASSSINQEVDLRALAEDLDAEFEPDQFPGLVYRAQNPSVAVLIFDSGKVVCTGAKSISDVHEAITDTVQTLRELEVDAPRSPPVNIQNIVAKADLQRRLSLNATAIALGLEAVEYEPEQFPGLVYRLDDPDITVLLFGSGKLIITGAQHRSESEAAFTNIQTQLSKLGLLEGGQREYPRNVQ